jgi:thymidylate kinase
METETEGYHQKVRQGYRALAVRSKKRFKILDGEKTVDAIHDTVIHYVKELLQRKGYRI